MFIRVTSAELADLEAACDLAAFVLSGRTALVPSGREPRAELLGRIDTLADQINAAKQDALKIEAGEEQARIVRLRGRVAARA